MQRLLLVLPCAHASHAGHAAARISDTADTPQVAIAMHIALHFSACYHTCTVAAAAALAPRSLRLGLCSMASPEQPLLCLATTT